VTIDPRLLLTLFLIEVVRLAAIIYALYRLRARRTAPPKPGPGEMRFELKDSMVERASERLVEGGERSEVTELWTFMRAPGGSWLLSAIQQT
jgi:hypothetical protein